MPPRVFSQFTVLFIKSKDLSFGPQNKMRLPNPRCIKTVMGYNCRAASGESVLFPVSLA